MDEWDRQIARDSESGKLDKLIEQAVRSAAMEKTSPPCNS
jgi:hypothetical protein